MKQILYISDVNASEPIFHSQVLPHIEEMRKSYHVSLLCLSRGESFGAYDYRYNSLNGDYNKTIAFFNYIKNRKKLNEFLKKNDFTLIYSRGFRGGLLGAFLKKYYYKRQAILINDVRGDALDEDKGHFFRLRSFYSSTRTIFKNSDTIFFVSSYLRDKYCEKFRYEGKTAIFPTFVPANKFKFSEIVRRNYKDKLGYTDDDIVLLYSGNLAKWQNIDVILDAFSGCNNNSVKLLIITKDKSIDNIIITNRNRKNIQTFAADYADIQNYYFAADFGLLIRDDIDTNRCSAPTKFSEYINSGLNLIATKITADYIDFLLRNSENHVLLNSKADLREALNKLARVKRIEMEINTLEQIVKGQIEIFELSIR